MSENVWDDRPECNRCGGHIPRIGSVSPDRICPHCYRLVTNPELQRDEVLV